jgi:predicted Rossmann-fold nucleotide-binding protein
MKSVCVYCGSSAGSPAGYREAARELGHEPASRGLGLVYGGAGIGVMGAVAERFVRAEHRPMPILEQTPASLLDRFEVYQAPRVRKWLGPEET